MTDSLAPKFETWAVVELMGHVRLGGKVTEEERFGIKMGRIDIPCDDTFVTQYFGGQSVYRLTPCSEEIARSVATYNKPEVPYELRLLGKDPDDSDEYEDEEDEEIEQEFGSASPKVLKDPIRLEEADRPE